jgi:hypothetical protein
VIVHENGSEFYFLRTDPSTLMLVGTGTKVSRRPFRDHDEHADKAAGTVTRDRR